ncbi:MAG: amidohydrolase family protein, partial [Firmicutes bacterium]|nr:amidohydrolase family protein [Bacillota bacterium]
MELLIKHVMIVDGTGAPAYRGTVGVEQGKICLVAKEGEMGLDGVGEQSSSQVQVIDGEGLYLSPGFIDAHSHGDGIYGTDFGQLCKTSQGITTEICGQCGFSFYPVNPKTLGQLQQFLTLFTNEFSEDMNQWTDFSTYKKYMETVPLTCNTAILTGHGTLRVAVMGNDNRKPTEEELEQMKVLLKEAMDHGSIGLSTGLIYPPGSFSHIDEIVELAKVIA